MKITEQRLREIITEELMNENFFKKLFGMKAKGGEAASRTSNPSATLISGGVNRTSAARAETAQTKRQATHAINHEPCRKKTGINRFSTVRFMCIPQAMILISIKMMRNRR